MSQSELQAFFEWCAEHMAGFEKHDCDESEHYYIGESRIGGWAGDRGQFFFDQNDVTARTLRMMDAFSSQGV